MEMVMLTKRQAIVAIYMGCLAKMAHADQPPEQKPKPLVDNWTASDWTVRIPRQEPTMWWVNLDMMKDLHVVMGDKTITVSAAEIFSALSDTAQPPR